MHYRPIDSMKAPRFCGIRTFMRLPHLSVLEEVDVAVVGVPVDSAVGYRSGARFGPEAIRSASILLRDYNQSQQINVPDTLSMVDYGDAPVLPGYHEESLKRVQEHLEPIYRAGVTPLVLGGRPFPDNCRTAGCRCGLWSGFSDSYRRPWGCAG